MRMGLLSSPHCKKIDPKSQKLPHLAEQEASRLAVKFSERNFAEMGLKSPRMVKKLEGIEKTRLRFLPLAANRLLNGFPSD